MEEQTQSCGTVRKTIINICMKMHVNIVDNVDFGPTLLGEVGLYC